jgi:hypothetical protein
MGLNAFQDIQKTYDLNLKFIFTLEVIKIKNYENKKLRNSIFRNLKFRNFEFTEIPNYKKYQGSTRYQIQTL